MEQNGLFLLALQQIHDFPFTRRNESRFITPELGFVRSVEGMEEISESILIPGKPYRLTEGRIVYIRSGHIRVRINLREVIVSSNQLVVTSPGAVLEFVEMPKNIDVTMLTFVDDFMEGWQKEPLLHAYLQGGIFFVVDLNEKERKRLVMFLDLIWDVLHDEPFPRDTVRSLISALFRQMEVCYHRDATVSRQEHTRREKLFNRFINLVNKYAVSERNVSFYAGNLYLTPRYLSTVIRDTSGKTVMDWVNEAVIQEAKLQLCYTDKLVYQIADDLNFPNASFFCKFFRRITGKTPYEYRKERSK